MTSSQKRIADRDRRRSDHIQRSFALAYGGVESDFAPPQEAEETSAPAETERTTPLPDEEHPAAAEPEMDAVDESLPGENFFDEDSGFIIDTLADILAARVVEAVLRICPDRAEALDIAQSQIPSELRHIAEREVDDKGEDPVLRMAGDGSAGCYWAGIPTPMRFVEDGKIYLGGVDKTPTWTTAQKEADNLYVEIDFENATVTASTGTAPANTDTLEHYQIVRNGVQVQNSDIHESRAA